MSAVDAVLVVAGPDGPEVRRGRVHDLGSGGCTVRLDVALHRDAPGGALVLRTGSHEAHLLTGPVEPMDAGRVVELRFVAPVEPDPGWPDLLDSFE